MMNIIANMKTWK